MFHSSGSYEDAESPRRGSPKTLGRLLPYLKPHRKALAFGLSAMMIGQVCNLAGPMILRWVIDHGIIPGSSDAILYATAAYVAAFVVGAGVQYAQVLVLSRMGLRIVTALKEKVFGHLLFLSTKFHDKNPVGKLIARTESDSESIKELFSRNAVQIAGGVLQFTLALGIMLILHFELAVVFLGLVPLLAGGTYVFLRIVRRLYRKARRRYAELSGMVTEYVQGVPVVQQYEQKERASRILEEKNLAKYRVDLRVWTLDYTFWGVFLYFEVIATAIIILLFKDRLLAGAGSGVEAPSFGTLVLFIEYTMRVFMPIMHLGEQLDQVQKALAAGDRVFELLDTAPEVLDRPGAADRVRLEREIRFEDVSFTYTGEEMVLKDVSFTVGKGEKVALVGPSGGGKSTIVSLLLRFVDPTKGRITVDGADLRDHTLEAWRSRIGLVLQEIYLFPGSLLDNLRVLDEGVPASAVKRAAEVVKADRFIEELPCGYDSDLAERGANLSLGERQLLSFARALAIDPDILILDEATSSVDPETEARIQDSLELLLTGRTAVIVAHRLTTIRNADRILVVKGGRIVEEGSHDELYARRRLYRELYDLQVEGNRGGGRP